MEITTAVKHRAQRRVRAAVRDGKIVRGPCEVCGTEPTDGHHDDYTQPLNVRWLCREHHAALHRGTPGVTRSGPYVLWPEHQPYADRLKVAMQASAEAQQVAEQCRVERNDALHAAITAGMTHAEIARATGLTRVRVGQLALALGAHRPGRPPHDVVRKDGLEQWGDDTPPA